MHVAARGPAARVTVGRPQREVSSQPFVSCQAADRVPITDAASTTSNCAQPGRRQLLGAAFMVLTAGSAQPSAAMTESTTLCALATTSEEAQECREKSIAGDQDAFNSLVYKTDRKFELAEGVPVANLDQDYYRSTLDLAEKLEAYCQMDVRQNKERVRLIKEIKAEGAAWVSKYARGGSARTESARRFYIAVDGLVGFFASNGLGQLPASKSKIWLEKVAQARQLLKEGK